MSSPTVPIQFVHRALHTVARSGVDVNVLLRGTGVSPDLVVNRRDRKSTRLNSSHLRTSRMPSSA